jgi:hypothetical protein
VTGNGSQPAPDANGPGISEEHEALIQFLYLAPVGLVQAAMDGSIGMINPISAQLLMPLSRDGNLDNLFTALEGVAPSLRAMCAQFTAPNGVVCDAMHLHLDARGQGPGKAVVSLTVVKLDHSRLMAVLSDVSPGDVSPGDASPGDASPGDASPRHPACSPIIRAQGGDNAT